MDVDAYLSRIGLSGPLTPDLANLEGLQRAHLTAVPFENLDVFARRGVRTDDDWTMPAWVYDVHTRRGRQRGATKRTFLRTEHDALTDPTTIFGNVDEMLDSPRYVQPQLDLGL